MVTHESTEKEEYACVKLTHTFYGPKGSIPSGSRVHLVTLENYVLVL